MNPYLYFDHASTTRCTPSAIEALKIYSDEEYGNPSSNHIMGQRAARAIREARLFFSRLFNIDPEQIIFTSGGTEANNLAVAGIAIGRTKKCKGIREVKILSSSIEHSSVYNTANSLKPFNIQSELIPVYSNGQTKEESLRQQLVAGISLVSIQQVNQIIGSQTQVENIAKIVKASAPESFFHTDSVQAFGKINLPRYPSSIDLVSISGHKIGGPKGVGALILLNPKLLQSQHIHPLLHGGGQEGNLRSGTQNAGLIAGFHLAAVEAIEKQNERQEKVTALQLFLKNLLLRNKLLEPDLEKQSALKWNSPTDAIPNIISLSAPGLRAGPLAKLLEERMCLISVGSACHSNKGVPDPVLKALGFSLQHQQSTFRVSLSFSNTFNEIEILVHALQKSIQQMEKLLGKPLRRTL